MRQDPAEMAMRNTSLLSHTLNLQTLLPQTLNPKPLTSVLRRMHVSPAALDPSDMFAWLRTDFVNCRSVFQGFANNCLNDSGLCSFGFSTWPRSGAHPKGNPTAVRHSAALS